MVWVLCKNNNGLTPIGIFSTEDEARAAAVDGAYAAIPVEAKMLYENLIDIGMTGVSLFVKQGESSRLAALESKADQILANQATITARLDETDGLLDQARTAILDLRDRVSALEEA
jgi:hypothetical protein